jgi:hypothetical protein
VSSAPRSGSTRQLTLLCAGYFICYVATGVSVKYFTELSSRPVSQLVYLFQNTAASSLFVILLVLALGWHRLAHSWMTRKASWPVALSGFCTAVVIPATTLMYLLPISVLVAMVIMRGSVIVISRLVDAILIHQGVLKKKVSWEEDLAVTFALLAVAMNLLAPSYGERSLSFIHNRAALTILGIYLAAYSIRLYVMNVYRDVSDNRAYFTLEQLWATIAMLGAAVVPFLVTLPASSSLRELRSHVFQPHLGALASGICFGGVAFFSVFIFMFPGRTATFSGVANRLTSLTAGTVSTVLLAIFWGKSFPSLYEWASLLWIGIATLMLIRAERSREVASQSIFKRRGAVRLRKSGIRNPIPTEDC